MKPLICAFIVLITPTIGMAQDELDILMDSANIKAEQHIELISEGDYATAYSDYISDVKRAMTLEECKSDFSKIFSCTGKLLNYSITDRYFITDYETRQVIKLVIMYMALFERMECEIETNFAVDIDGSIKMSKFVIIVPPTFDNLRNIYENKSDADAWFDTYMKGMNELEKEE